MEMPLKYEELGEWIVSSQIYGCVNKPQIHGCVVEVPHGDGIYIILDAQCGFIHSSSISLD